MRIPALTTRREGNPRRESTVENKLAQLIEAARTKVIDDTAREEQRINFAYGNAAEGDHGSTKESVRAASVIMKNQ